MRHRGAMSAAERDARSRLCKLLNDADAFVHGSWIAMSRRCGHAGCKCAKDEKDKHVSHYVGQTRQGHTRMQSVPRDQETQVHRWIENYKLARELLEQISEEAWKRIKRRKE